MKPILVSGMQPTGRLHIGNYLGALKNFVELQNSGKYQCHFFLADLHALTEGPAPKALAENILNLTADYLAAGIDPKKSVVYQQSQIPAHSELAWVLNTVTPMGELERMTQFKDKAKISNRYLSDFLNNMKKLREELVILKKYNSTNFDTLKSSYLNTLADVKSFIGELDNFNENKARANIGLFDYPVLMAADILIYDAKFIPVGEDQLQHLELARTVARKFNARFGATFVEPKGLLTQTPRVMSLKDPRKKMSKSDPDSCLFIDDSPEEIKRKLARAVTDSGSEILYDPEKKPGLSNLLEIYGAFAGKDPHAVAIAFEGKQYSDLKSGLAGLIAGHFAKFRAQKAKLLAKPAAMKKILVAGSKKAGAVATKKMAVVKKKVGY